jgi:hypothetical protein
MAANIKSELVVGITDQMKDAIETVCTFQGLKPSQFWRIAILEKLVALQAMEHPGHALMKAKASNAD